MNKKLFYVAAAAAVMASCADDELITTTANGSDAQQGKLVKTGLVSSAREALTTEATRALSPIGNFVWMPTKFNDDGTIGLVNGKRSNQKVGFCWTGVDEGGFGAVAEAGVNVYTNYEFEHVGWLDLAANNVEYDECTGDVNNGAFIKGEGNPEANWHSVAWTGRYSTNGKSYYYSDGASSHLAKGQRAGGYDLGLGKGIFKTNNASVFQGEYLVYYPYTDKFTKGPVIANEPESFEVNMNALEIDRFATYSDYGFCLGWMKQYVGGNSSTGFTSSNFAAYATIQLVNDNPNSGTAPGAKNVESVVLYSAANDILVQKGINAKEATNWVKNGGSANASNTVWAAEDDAIYTVSDKDKKVSTVYANLNDGTNPYITIPGAATATPIATQNVIIPVLPQLVEDLKIIVVFSDGTSQVVSKSNTSFQSGQATLLPVNIYGGSDRTYYAFDEASFVKGVERAYGLGAATSLADRKSTIKVLNNITLDKANDGLYPDGGIPGGTYNLIQFRNNLTIEADASNETAGITVASHTTRSIMQDVAATCSLTIKVPVIIEGYGCCETKPAKLEVAGRGAATTVKFTKKITDYGTLVLGNGNQKYTIEADEIEVAWDEDYVKAQKSKNGANYTKGSWSKNLLTDAAKLYIGGVSTEASNVTIKQLNNNGGSVKTATTTVDNFDADANLSVNTPTTMANRTINVKVLNNIENTGKFKNGAPNPATEASHIVGGDVTVGENVHVVVNGYVDNTNEIANVHILGNGFSDTKDGRLDIFSSGTNEGTIDNRGVVNFMATLENNGIFIDRLNAEVGGVPVDNGVAGSEYIVKWIDGIHTEANMYRTDLNKDGLYVTQVNTDERMAFVLSDVVVYRSSNVVEILEGTSPLTYNLASYEHDLATKDVRVALNDYANTVTFTGWKEIAGENKAQYKKFGDCVDIIKGYVVTEDGYLSTVKDVKVYGNSTFNTHAESTADHSTATVGRDLIVNESTGKVVHNAENLTITRDVNNNGTINANKEINVGQDLKNNIGATFSTAVTAKFAVTGNVEQKGTFTSNGTPNTVGGNFTQTAGASSFAYRTTTTINGIFSCTGGTFQRNALGSGSQYRATVNCGTLGSVQGGSTTTAWPTQM